LGLPLKKLLKGESYVIFYFNFLLNSTISLDSFAPSVLSDEFVGSSLVIVTSSIKSEKSPSSSIHHGFQGLI